MHHIGLHSKTVTSISSALNHCVNDYLEQSWEEALYPALDMLEHVGPLHHQKDQTSHEYFASVTSGSNVEFEFGKLVTYIENLLATVVQMSIKLGGEVDQEKIDDFPGDDENHDDTIHEETEVEKSEWLSETLPAGAVLLVGEKLEKIEKEEEVKEEEENVESPVLDQIHEEREPDIEDEFI